MNPSYYYFAASLPVLHFEGTPPISHEHFLDDCRRLLSAGDYAVVEKARLIPDDEPDGVNAVLDSLRMFLRSYRNEAVRFRCQRAGSDPAGHLREGGLWHDPFWAQVIAQAVKAGTLRESERFIDRAIWERLDELAAGHFFDLEFLIVYAVKLQMLERQRDIDSSAGAGAFNKMKEAIHTKELMHA